MFRSIENIEVDWLKFLFRLGIHYKFSRLCTQNYFFRLYTHYSFVRLYVHTIKKTKTISKKIHINCMQKCKVLKENEQGIQ